MNALADLARNVIPLDRPATPALLRALADRIERGEVVVRRYHDSHLYRDAPQHRELTVAYTEVKEQAE